MEEESRLGDVIAGQLMASETDAISAARAIAEAEDVSANPAQRACFMPCCISHCPCAGALVGCTYDCDPAESRK